MRITGLWLLLPGLAASLPAAAATPDVPNVVLILIDDLGAADLQADGAELAETPALDRLRRQGVSFTQAYAPAPICSASRASLLTGRSPARLHFEFVTKPKGSKPPARTVLVQPAFPTSLPLEEVSLAELLAPAGYVTGYLGKWHLNQEEGRYLAHGTTHGPAQQGFAETSEERGSHPYGYAKSRGEPPGPSMPDGVYEPDALTDRAIAFLRDHRADRFFLQLSHYYVHDPVATRCAWLVRKYQEKAARLGQKISDEHIRYAAFVEVMDHLVGRVLTEIDALDLARNTVVIFTSDNGGMPVFTDNGPLRGSKWTLYEGGLRVPLLVRWPEVAPAGAECGVPVIGTDLFPTLAAITRAPRPVDRVLDGVDLSPLLASPTRADVAPRKLLWHFPFYHEPFVRETPASALRDGNLKLVHHYEDERSELFDLSVDPGEAHDLAATLPGETARLRTELLQRLQAMDARMPVRRAMASP